MSTRSRIGMKMSDGKIKSIYCHWDGYPSGVGKVLQKHYKDPKKIEGLLELGDISSLGSVYKQQVSENDWTKFEKINPANVDDFLDQSEDCTVAYKDKGEDCPARIDSNEEEYINKIGKCGEEYAYLFKEDYNGVYRWHIMEAPFFRRLDDFEDDGNECSHVEKNMGSRLVAKIMDENGNEINGLQFN